MESQRPYHHGLDDVPTRLHSRSHLHLTPFSRPLLAQHTWIPAACATHCSLRNLVTRGLGKRPDRHAPERIVATVIALSGRRPRPSALRTATTTHRRGSFDIALAEGSQEPSAIGQPRSQCPPCPPGFMDILCKDAALALGIPHPAKAPSCLTPSTSLSSSASIYNPRPCRT